MTQSRKFVIDMTSVQDFYSSRLALWATSRLLWACKQRQTLQCALQVWSDLSKSYLTPEVPFHVHQTLARHVFRAWDVSMLGPHPLWYPSAQTAAETNVAKFIAANAGLCRLPVPEKVVRSEEALWHHEPAGHHVAAWERLHAVSVHHPEAFWPAVLRTLGIEFTEPSMCVLQHSRNGSPDDACWFPGARLNIADIALHNPLADPDHPALVFASEECPSECDLQQHCGSVCSPVCTDRS
jgi:Acetyl-coenzyme A synthetase N-terminus